MAPLVTVVTPVLRDSKALRALMPQVPAIPEVEMVVVDGAAGDELERLIQGRPGTRLCRTSPGRGHQMNSGASGAAGEWLLFLHADSHLPAGWLQAFGSLQAEVVGGWFQFALDDAAWQARLIERLVALRVRFLTLPYGDQGLFVRRRVFESMGGFSELPLFEDVDFVRRLIRHGPVVQLPLALRTSSRRWTRDGWFQRSIRNSALVSLYFAGVSPAWLADRYEPAKGSPSISPRS